MLFLLKEPSRIRTLSVARHIYLYFVCKYSRYRLVAGVILRAARTCLSTLCKQAYSKLQYSGTSHHEMFLNVCTSCLQVSTSVMQKWGAHHAAVLTSIIVLSTCLYFPLRFSRRVRPLEGTCARFLIRLHYVPTARWSGTSRI